MKTYYQKNKEKRLAYQRKFHAAHPDYKREYRKKHPVNPEKQKEYYAKWYKKNGRNRTNNDYEKVLEWRQEHPRRVIIHARLNYAVKSGKIKRPNICPKCGKISRLHAHHLDYKHFMNFVWLCASCHKKEHNQNRL